MSDVLLKKDAYIQVPNHRAVMNRPVILKFSSDKLRFKRDLLALPRFLL